ncbi:hypothetical protein SUGI_0752650 [Cryptomeria japonica]|uniref:cyclic dof factor 2 n=1 Tax=Cryptomeria japonica TaxID=3369 RepID=UPI002414CEA6|nr:cyclic dof factor 2 [Cryptomeria japonica]GLJ37118.1 hypothetical protein SUGI_0752650 [Cryptomeria japonica]
MSNCMTWKEREGFDPGFKLFGKTIPVCHKDEKKPSVEQEQEQEQDHEHELDPIVVQSSSCEQTKDNAGVEGEEEVGSSETEAKKEEAGGQAVLKKPDKLLPCPRCESMDTKFCYYNNYNVNQPRHFCKNCQRYWTAGGSLRNVPVGAGRRKNKQSMEVSPHRRQLRSALGYGGEDYDNPIACGRPLKLGRPTIQIDGATVLNFGPDGKTHPEQQNRDEISCGSSITAEREAAGHMNTRRPNGTVAGCPPVPFFTGPWPYGWNVNVGAPPGPWGPMPWPIVPGTPWATGPWMPAPWPIGPAPSPAPVPAPATVSTNNQASSDCRGKRAADACLYVPKTLRIDDPGEAAQSSIWASLGLGSTECSASAFKAFKPKTEVQSAAASHALRANPAAFSRSISFQESN